MLLMVVLFADSEGIGAVGPLNAGGWIGSGHSHAGRVA